MYYELNDTELEKINEIIKIVEVDYTLRGNLILVDDLIGIIKDLLFEYHNINNKLEDLEEEIKNNYQALPEDDLYDLYGVNRNDF